VAFILDGAVVLTVHVAWFLWAWLEVELDFSTNVECCNGCDDVPKKEERLDDEKRAATKNILVKSLLLRVDLLDSSSSDIGNG